MALISAASLATACIPEPSNEAANAPAIGNSTGPLPSLAVADPALDRAALLIAVARAASAAALGQNDSAQQRTLQGKEFEVRIRFGCPSGGAGLESAVTTAPFTIRFTRDDRILRIRATPDITLEEEWIAALAGDAVEAVEGFWMYRPWLLDDGCTTPVVNVQNERPAAEDSRSVQTARTQRVGLAQFYSADDARTGRRDERAFETTTVLKAEENLSTQGYNLVLSGRLQQLQGGRVVSCRLQRNDVAPDCVVSAKFDRVQIENPVSKAVLAEWTP